MSYIGQAMSIITFAVAYHGITNVISYEKQTTLYDICIRLLRTLQKWINIENVLFYINQIV